MVSVVNKNAKELFDYCKHAPKYFRGCLPYAKKFNHLVYNTYHIAEDVVM